MMKKRKLENETSTFDIDHNSITNLSTTYLCDDILTAILTRCPVKSVMRFTCVSKSWNSLIRSPTFIAAHDKIVREDSLCRRYLLYMGENLRLYSPLATFTCETSAEQRFNSMMPFDSYEVVGSCGGLVCVVDHSQVCLWNPLLKTHIIVPPSPLEKTYAKIFPNIVLGLGYSRKKDDHRIVKIIYNPNSSPSNEVEMYSLKLNSWKSIACSAPALAEGSSGVFINGYINWVVTRRGQPVSTMIMWFDIDEEVFGEADLSVIESIPQLLRKRAADVIKELLKIPKECEEYYNKLRSLWKMKALARESSWVQLWIYGTGVKAVEMFDGEILIEACSQKLINFLDFKIRKSSKKKDSSSQKVHVESQLT